MRHSGGYLQVAGKQKNKKNMSLEFKNRMLHQLILSLLVAIFFSSCGIFIRKPHYNESYLKKEKELSSIFCYENGACNYLDIRLNESSQVIVIALHGLGAHAGSFSYIQEHLTDKNISSISIDLRGFGHWALKKGDLKNIGLQINDLHEIIQTTRRLFPSQKIVLLGESLGSSLGLWYSEIYPDNIDGLILTSMVTSNGGDDVKVGTILNLLFAYTFCPSKTVKLSYNPKIYSNDSIFVNWAFNIDTLGTRSISPRYLVQANKLVKKSYNYMCNSKKQILLIQGGKDILSTPKKLNKLIQKMQFT